MTSLDVALSYTKRGWQIIAVFAPVPGTQGGCTCGKKYCAHPGKHPLTPHGIKDATADETTIRSWFARSPDANIGIATGSTSNITVLDVDFRHAGGETLDALCAKYGPLSPTLVAKSGGGLHYYFRHPAIPLKSRAGALGAGIDLRDEGAYVVAPPGLHYTGLRYAWQNELPPAEMPAWMLEHLTGASDLKNDDDDDSEIPEGRRNDRLTRIAGKLHRLGLSAEEMSGTLLAINRNRCKPPLRDGEVEKIAKSISQKPRTTNLDVVISDRRPDLVCLADVAPEKVDWLSHPHLPKGKLVLLEGDPSAGKTFLALAMAAAITLGRPAIPLGDDDDQTV